MINVILIIFSIITIIFVMIKQLHMIQLNSYNLDQQLLWYKKNYVSFSFNGILLLLCLFQYLIKFVNCIEINNKLRTLYIGYILLLIIVLINNYPKKQKKALVYTKRIKRLIAMTVCLFALVGFIFYKFINMQIYFIFVLLASISPLIVFISYLFMLPIENNIRKKFMKTGAKIINESKDLFVIGVTGSYGKTSVKYYLKKVLGKKYNICITPESYNTAMGAVLTIKNDLKSYDDIFVCEMGARRVGDVKEICEIVSPNACVITDVGNMHLDTFHNIENVRKCKFELLDSVYNNYRNNNEKKLCIALVNGDNTFIKEKLSEYSEMHNNIYTYGFDSKNDFVAEIMSSDCYGTKFKVKYKLNNNEDEMTFATKLLGRFNVMNLTSAIGYALIMNIDKNDIIDAVNSVEAVPHRLQLLNYDKNNLIIDDAYNANPNGVKNSLDTIATFNDYIKIIITPGMVELGDIQDIENNIFAKYSKGKIDYAFVVGNTNKKALMSGFTDVIDKEKVIYFEKVEEAIFYARNNISGKKVILLENDLSDNY